jgi:hypothetical protein
MATLTATDPTQEPLHLVSQRDQPYGSVQRCCEVCGRMCWRGMDGSAKRWTDDPATFEAAPDRCDRTRR